MLSNLEKPIEFDGRLYKGSAVRDAKNMNYTVDDLRAMNLSGTELWLEHNKSDGVIGTIVNNWVDPENWLCVHGRLHPPQQLGRERHESLRQRLRNGELRDLSIHWFGSADRHTGVVDPQSKCIVEVSLTKKGLFEGTHLLSVAAASDSQNRPVLHYATSALNMAQGGVVNISDQVTLEEKLGIRFTDEERQAMAGLTSEQIALYALNKVMETRGGVINGASNNSANEAELNAMRAQAAQAQELAAKVAAFEKDYAEQNLEKNKPLFELLNKSGQPKEKLELFTQGLTEILSNPERKHTAELLGIFASGALAHQKSTAELNRANKQLAEFQKAQAQAQQPQFEGVGQKRGIDKTAPTPEMSAPKFAAGQQPVEVAASLEAAYRNEVNQAFPRAWGNMNAENPHEQMLNSLVERSKLGVPVASVLQQQQQRQQPGQNQQKPQGYSTVW